MYRRFCVFMYQIVLFFCSIFYIIKLDQVIAMKMRFMRSSFVIQHIAFVKVENSSWECPCFKSLKHRCFRMFWYLYKKWTVAKKILTRKGAFEKWFIECSCFRNAIKHTLDLVEISLNLNTKLHGIKWNCIIITNSKDQIW